MNCHRHIGAAFVSLTLVACATAPASMETCDPNQVNNVWQSGRCGVAFEQRIAALEQQIQSINEQRRVTDADAARFNAEAERLAADAAELDLRLSSLQLKVGQMRSNYQTLTAETAEQKHIIKEMKAQAGKAQAELNRVREMAAAPAREIAQLEATIEAQEGAINDLQALYNTVE